MAKWWRGSVVAAFALAAGAACASEFFVPGGKDLAVTNLAKVPVPPNSVCVVSCEAKRLQSGFVLCGTGSANCDFTSSWSGWKRLAVVFRAPSAPGGQGPRVGTYNSQAGALFRDVSIRTARAEYLKKAGMTLGHGESLDGDIYTFEAHLGSAGHTDSRPLDHWRGAYFNTHRFCMSKGCEIVYRHTLSGRRLLSGEIAFGALHRGGAFAAEVSRDGESWARLHTMTNATSVTVKVPDSLFPADDLFVRFVGVDGGGLQLNSYRLKSRIDGRPVFASGSTRYLAEDGSLIAECRPSALHDDSYGELVASKDGISLWRASSGWKVSRRRPVPKAAAKAVTVRAAANESESVQLVVTPSADLVDVRVACGDLRMVGSCAVSGESLPASAVEVRRVGYVPVKIATDTLGGMGEWPDPLLPQDASPFAVAAGANQPFWLTVSVPKGARAGRYLGSLSVSATRGDGGSVSATVPFGVEVFGFALPDEPALRSSFGINPVNVSKWHHARTDAERRATIDRYWKVYSAYRISPGRPAPYDDWEPKWDKSAGVGSPEKWEPVFDWSRWDAEMERVRRIHHFNAFNMKPWRFWSGFGDAFRKPDLAGLKSDHPAYPALLRKYLKGVGDHLREKGWTDDAYIYWYDEPTTATYPKVIEGMKVLKEAMPGVKRLLTEQPESALLGNVDIWCPMPHYLHTEHEAACRAAGETFWWYLCTEPKAPYFGEFIDRAGAELRLWGWASWKSGIKGILMWSATYWTSTAAYPDPAHPQDPYEDAMAWVGGGQAKPGERKPWGNGDGRFIYPPMKCVETAGDDKAAFVADDPVPTVRLAMVRDGVEDYEYLAMPKSLAPSHPLLVVPPEIHETDTRYNTDPSAMESRRIEIARAIEHLTKGSRP